MKSFREAFKLAKPGIALLLNLVAVTTFFLGIESISSLWKIAPLLFAGTFASFSSSLTNNYLDRDIDSKMSRTAWRANIGSNSIYLLSITGLLIASLSVSQIFLNTATTVWIFLGYLSYSFLYTVVLKRRTRWNIVLGGIAGSFPALAGWSAVNTSISPVSIFVAMLVFVWTPTHFWTLAMKYKNDYKRVGVPMMPSVTSEPRAVNLIIANTVILLIFSMLPIFFDFGFPTLYDYLVIPVSAYLLVRILMMKSKTGNDLVKSSLKAFLASNYYLTSLMFVLIIGAFLRFV